MDEWMNGWMDGWMDRCWVESVDCELPGRMPGLRPPGSRHMMLRGSSGFTSTFLPDITDSNFPLAECISAMD
jgi:hypothetical protein